METGIAPALTIFIFIIVAISATLWLWLSYPKKRRCLQCRATLPPNASECPNCHTPVTSTTIYHPVPTAWIICVQGPGPIRPIVMKSKEIQIGRSPDSDIRLDSELVSWKHALISFSDGQYVLYDQDSTNGTWVNGQRIARATLQPGRDQFQIGPYVFMLQLPGQPAPSPVPTRVPTPLPVPVERVYDFGEYERVATLGSGGAATVYKAISKRDGRVVAIKVLHHSDPYLRDKFKKEIELGKMLRHPHIVRVYGGGESQGVWYIVMEFMEGGTLRDRMYPGRPYPLDQIIHIAGQICDALQYAHKMGVYHRDIKPENIFFSSTGEVKLGDFGIARIAQSVTRTASGWLIGTPLYMSYEQAKGHPVDGRSDLYSLGVVLYELATGRCPFVAENPLAVLDKHIQEFPIPPSQINPNIPPHIEQAILRALEKDPARRFQTAEEMARALGYEAPMHGAEAYQLVVATPLPAEVPGTVPPVVTGTVHPDSLAAPLFRLVRFDGVEISLSGPITVLNRRTVNPGDGEISREHARIVRRGGYYWIEDMGSTNGTFVNGLRIFTPQLLQPGDEIQLGRTKLTVIAK